MFKAQVEANQSFVWTVIKLEQERLLAEVNLSIANVSAPLTHH
jgi:hypothetical protein